MARVTIELPGITAKRMQEVLEIVATALKGHIRETDHPLWIVDTEGAGIAAPSENPPEKPVCLCNPPKPGRGDHHFTGCPMQFDPDAIPF